MLEIILALLGKAGGALVTLFSNVWAWVILGFAILLACVWFEHAHVTKLDNQLAACKTQSAAYEKLASAEAVDLKKQNDAVDALRIQSDADTAAAQKAVQAAEARRPTVVTKLQRIASTPAPSPGVCQDKAIGSLIAGSLK